MDVLSECEEVAEIPAQCQVNIPHQDGYRKPLPHSTTCLDKKMEVLEVKFVLTHPPTTKYSSVRLELGTLNNNNTPLRFIKFERSPITPFFRSSSLTNTVQERLWFMCVQDYVGRVMIPWNSTTSSTIINISLQVFCHLYFPICLLAHLYVPVCRASTYHKGHRMCLRMKL